MNRKPSRPARTAKPDIRQAQTVAKPLNRLRAFQRKRAEPHESCPDIADKRKAERENRSRSAVPPRAQSPVPELKPAGTTAAPAHNSLSCEAEYRFFASARDNIITKRKPHCPRRASADKRPSARLRAPIPHSEFRTTSAVPPRAQTPSSSAVFARSETCQTPIYGLASRVVPGGSKRKRTLPAHFSKNAAVSAIASAM